MVEYLPHWMFDGMILEGVAEQAGMDGEHGF